MPVFSENSDFIENSILNEKNIFADFTIFTFSKIVKVPNLNSVVKLLFFTTSQFYFITLIQVVSNVNKDVKPHCMFPQEDLMEVVMLMHWTVPLGVFAQSQTIGYYQMERA